MAQTNSTRFSKFCTILLDNMKINKKKLFHALFDWTKNSPSYFSGTAFYPFIDGSRPLPDVFIDAFSHNSYSSAKKCIQENFLKRIQDDSILRKKLMDFIEDEINLSSEIRNYLLEDCKEDAGSFYTCILYMVLTGNQHLPPLKHIETLKTSLITNIPTPSSFFLGREDEMKTIKSKLNTFGICYVWGISGIGKSDLVCKYAKLEKANYTNIIYIRFHKSIETSVAMLEHLNYSDSYTISERFNMNCKILNSYQKETLVILDNFDICAENDPYFSWLTGCDFDLIITSRTTPLDVPNVHIRELSPLQVKELFKFHCDNDECPVSDDTIQTICEKLMYHTLVTILVAKAIKYTELSADEIIVALNKSLATLPTQTMISLSKDACVKTEIYSNFISELFTFANLNRPEKMLLCMIAVMPLEGITKSQFLSYTGEKTLDVINSFVRLGYIERGKNNTISMHPLIADTCIKTLSDVPRYAIKEVLSNFFFDVYAQKSYPSIDEQLIAVSICETILQHPEYELTQEMIDLTSFFTKCGQYLHTVDTSDYVISHKNNLGANEKDYSIALSAYYKGLALLQIGDKVEAKHSLADTITVLGNKDNFSLHEAELFFNAVIEHAACENDPTLCIKKLQEIKIDRDCLPQDNYEMLLSRIYFKIASNYLLLEDYDKAEDLFNESLLIRNRILGTDSVSSGLALGNIAFSFQKLKKYELAAEYYEKGIQILSKHYPKNHMNLIRMHLNCATAYHCANATPSNKLLSELHFNLATSSAENVVIENKTKKKKGFLSSLFDIPIMPLTNYDSSISELRKQLYIHPVANHPVDFDIKKGFFNEAYHPHGDDNAYMKDYVKRIQEEKNDNKN